jgi:hypothetical protein
VINIETPRVVAEVRYIPAVHHHPPKIGLCAPGSDRETVEELRGPPLSDGAGAVSCAMVQPRVQRCCLAVAAVGLSSSLSQPATFVVALGGRHGGGRALSRFALCLGDERSSRNPWGHIQGKLPGRLVAALLSADAMGIREGICAGANGGEAGLAGAGPNFAGGGERRLTLRAPWS